MRISKQFVFGVATSNMRKLLLILTVEIAMAIVCLSQQIPLDLLGRLTRWDGTHKVLFFGAGIIPTKERSIRAYANGVQRGSDIEIFKDFPSIEQVIVDDISAGPNGSTVIAGVLQFRSGSNRGVILTYDSSGTLRAIWDIEPYDAVALAADDNGNVFALGGRSEDEPNPRYPLLTRYAPDGGIGDQGLSSVNFREGSGAIDDDDEMAHPTLMLWQDKLLVFAPTANEVLVCTLSGAIITRTPLREVLLAIAKADKVAQASIHELMFVDETHVILNLIERTTEELENENIRHVMDERLRPRRSYRLDLKTMHFEQTSGLTDGKRIVGVVGDQLLILSPSGLASEKSLCRR